MKPNSHTPISLRGIFQHVPGIIYIRDSISQGITWCNKTAEDAFGYSEKEIIKMGKDIFLEVLHPDDFYLAEKSNQHYKVSNENFGGILRARRKDEQQYKWYVGISTIFEKDKNGKPLSTLCVFLDLTVIKHTQTQLGKALQDIISFQFQDLQKILTKREKEITHFVGEGFSNKEIAKKLQLSRYTVEGHRKNIRMKLNINNTSQLISLAKKIGL